MNTVPTHFVKWQCLAGFKLRRILSAELFMEIAVPGHTIGSSSMAAHCRDRWIDLAGALAILPEPAEFHLILACRPTGNGSFPVFEAGILAVGRARTKTLAKTARWTWTRS